MSKQCARCGVTYSLEKFQKDSRSPDGKSPRCKPCRRAVNAQWLAANPDKMREYRKKYEREKADRVVASKASYMNRHRDRAYEAARRWQVNNPHARNASTARRYAQKKQATPSWADPVVIEWFYFDALWMSEYTGIPHEVDHFYPLRGKTVSGLHCEANLRVIPAYENRRKNRFIEDEA